MVILLGFFCFRCHLSFGIVILQGHLILLSCHLRKGYTGDLGMYSRAFHSGSTWPCLALPDWEVGWQEGCVFCLVWGTNIWGVFMSGIPLNLNNVWVFIWGGWYAGNLGTYLISWGAFSWSCGGGGSCGDRLIRCCPSGVSVSFSELLTSTRSIRESVGDISLTLFLGDFFIVELFWYFILLKLCYLVEGWFAIKPYGRGCCFLLGLGGQ